ATGTSAQAAASPSCWPRWGGRSTMGRAAGSGSPNRGNGERQGRILVVMRPVRAGSRRPLSTSPFDVPPAAPPAERFAVQDQVTHDKYGLGRVISVQEEALVIDFGSRRVRIVMPCAKLAKL